MKLSRRVILIDGSKYRAARKSKNSFTSCAGCVAHPGDNRNPGNWNAKLCGKLPMDCAVDPTIIFKEIPNA